MAVDVFAEYPGQPQKKKRRRRGKFPFIKLEGWTTPDAEQPNTRPRYHVGSGQSVRVGKGDSYAQEAHDASQDGGDTSGDQAPDAQAVDQGPAWAPPDEAPAESAWQLLSRDTVGDYTPAAPEYTPPTPLIQRKPVDVGDYELPNQELFTYDSGEPGDLPTTYKYADGRVQDVIPPAKYSSPTATDLWYPEGLSNDTSILNNLPKTNESTFFANNPYLSARQAHEQFPYEAPQQLGQEALDVPTSIGGVPIPDEVRKTIARQMKGNASATDLLRDMPEWTPSAAGAYLSQENQLTWDIAHVVTAPMSRALKNIYGQEGLDTGVQTPGADDTIVLSPALATQFALSNITPSGVVMGGAFGLAGHAAMGMAGPIADKVAPELAAALFPAVMPLLAKAGIQRVGRAGLGFSDEFLPITSPAIASAADKAQTILAPISKARWLPLVGAVAGAPAGILSANIRAEQQGRSATLPEQVTGAIGGAALFGGVGWLARNQAKVWHDTLKPLATGVSFPDNPESTPTNNPVFTQWLEDRNTAEKAKAGFAVGDIPPTYYPGGTARYLWDSLVRKEWTDDAALLETLQSSVEKRQGTLLDTSTGQRRLLPNERFAEQQAASRGVDSAYEHWASEKIAPIVKQYGIDDDKKLKYFNMWSQAFMTAERALGRRVNGPELDVAQLAANTPSEKGSGPNTETVGKALMILAGASDKVATEFKDTGLPARWQKALGEFTDEFNWVLRQEGGSLTSPENIENVIANQRWLLFAQNVERNTQPKATPTRGMPWIAMQPDLRHAADETGLTYMSLEDTVNAMHDRMRLISQAKLGNFLADARELDRDGLGNLMIRVEQPHRVPRTRPSKPGTDLAMQGPGQGVFEGDYVVTDWGDRPPGPTSRPMRERDLPSVAQNAVERTGAEVAPTTQHAPGVEEPRVGTPAFPEHEATGTGPGPRPSTFRPLSEDMPQPQGPHADLIRQSQSVWDIPQDVRGRLGIHERDMAQAHDDTYRALTKDKAPLIGDDTWRARAIKEHGEPTDIRDEDVNALRARQGKQPYTGTGTYPEAPEPQPQGVLPPGAPPPEALPSGQPHEAMQIQPQDAGPLSAEPGIHLNDMFPTEREKMFGPDPDGKGGTVWFGSANDLPPKGWNFIHDFRNGKQVPYIVPDWMATQLEGASPMATNMAIRMHSQLIQPFRSGVTVLSPAFGLFRNPVKDVGDAIQNTGMPWQIITRWPEVFLSTLMQPEFQQFRQRAGLAAGMWAGGTQGFNKDDRENAGWQERLGAAATYGLLAGAATNPQLVRRLIQKLRPGMNSPRDMQAIPLPGHVAETDPRMAAIRDKLGDWADPWGKLSRRIAANQRATSEMLSHGGRIGTVAEDLRPMWSRQTESLLGIKNPNQSAAGKTLGVITAPIEMMRAASELLELTTRGTVYRVMREPLKNGGRGMSAEEATAYARGATVDFSKAGSAMRVVNTIFPLLNAREQGALRSAKAWNEDPSGYTMRAIHTWGLPTAALQAYWRSDPHLSDLYDKINERDKESNWILPAGATYFDPKTGEEKALYWKAPKSPPAQIFSMPVEHIVDLMMHTQNHGIELEPGQRVERNAGHKWAQNLLDTLVPVNIDVKKATDPMEWMAGLAQMNPFLAYGMQKYANWDDFMNQPVIPDEQAVLPKRFQIGNLPSRAAIQTSEKMREIGMPEWMTPSPADIQLFAKSFGGTFAMQFMGAGDQVMDGTGIMPDVPAWAQQQQKPEGVADAAWRQYIDSINPNQNDAKIPRWAEALHGIVGTAGGQQTIAAKVKEMSPQEQTIWNHTQDLYAHYADWTNYDYLPRKQAIVDDPTKTAAQKARDMDNLNAEKRGVFEGLHNKYTQALVDPKSREQFKATLPGVPVTIDQIRSFQDLPDTLDPVAIEDAWYRPRGLGPDELSQLRPPQLQRLRQTEINNLAQEHQADPKVLMDYVHALESKREMKVIGVAANWLDDAVNRFQRPGYDAEHPDARLSYQVDEKDEYGNPTGQIYDHPLLLRSARQAELDKMAAEYGVDKNTLRDRINLRMSGTMVSPVEHSRRRAQDFYAEVNDPLENPTFVIPLKKDDGTESYVPLTTSVNDELAYEDLLGKYSKIPVNQRPQEIQELADAKKLGTLNRNLALWNDPRYEDYERWYGVGKNMTDDAWKKYQTTPRYRGAQVSDNAVFDQFAKTYEETPVRYRTPEMKANYKEIVRRKITPPKNSDLYDPQTGELTDLGQMLEELRQERIQGAVGGGQDVRVGKGADDDGDGYDDDTGEPVDQPVEDQVPDMSVSSMEDWTFDEPSSDVAPDANPFGEAPTETPVDQPSDNPFATDTGQTDVGDTDVPAAAPPLDIPTDDEEPDAPAEPDPQDVLFNAPPAGDVRPTPISKPFVPSPNRPADEPPPSGTDDAPIDPPPDDPKKIEVDGWRQWLKQEFGVEDDTFPWDQTTSEELLDYLDGTDNVQDARRALSLIRERIASGHVYVPSRMRHVY